eukprot:TRINITY_DN113023_c0_g1_i1.p1 TRINITY_DN113023_c0_g1~~TRINITY_DN113023_c0_g1_i1.p1  ORF type:complete len:464 (-),score=112.92 TRINITY_DN113023_c0_g1_i1:341-1732(-)
MLQYPAMGVRQAFSRRVLRLGASKAAVGRVAGAQAQFPASGLGLQRRCIEDSAAPEKAYDMPPKVYEGPPEDPRLYRPMGETIRTFLNPAHFLALLKSHGTTFFTGVPDSLLKDVLAYVTDNVSAQNHIISPNEGTALATAAGHYLATGKIPCVYLQNSGLGNIVNPLLSLCSQKVYSVPVLLIIGWRGEPGKKDEPQHTLQGKVTPTLLKEMGIPFEILPDYAEGAFEVLTTAYEHMEEHKAPFALLVKRQTFDKYKLTLKEDYFEGPSMLHREEVLERIIDEFPSNPIVSTTGFTSRELFELRVAKKQSHENDFLTVGSMGHCSSIALGISLAKPQQDIVCIDGDGAAIMHMGSFSAGARCGGANYKHILINNAQHDSVGGQPTGAIGISFPDIARACKYNHVATASTVEEIEAELKKLRETAGPGFLEVKVKPGARADLGRPTTTTHQNKDAFMNKLLRD